MPDQPPITKTEFERLITDGVVKPKLTSEQKQRYENTLYRQHRVDMGHFYRCVCSKQFDTDYQAYIKKLEAKKLKGQKKNKLGLEKRGRKPIKPANRRNQTVKGYFTGVESLKIDHVAEQLGFKSVSDFVRETLLQRTANALFEERPDRRKKNTYGTRF